MKKVKRKTKKSVKILLLIVLVIIVIVLFCKFSFKKKRSVSDSLIGKWTTDGNTVYHFNDDDTGALIVPLSTYEFKYKIDGDKLSIDFKNDKAEDFTYTYTLKGNKLKLKGKNGDFNFKKIEEK